MSRVTGEEDTDRPLLPASSQQQFDDEGDDAAADTDRLLPPPSDGPPDVNDDSSLTTIARVQRSANLSAHILSVTCVLVVLWWISLLGGLSTSSSSVHVFNWHPVLMITAFCFMTVAALAFRNRRRPRRHDANNANNANSRSVLKWTHSIAWTVAALCAIVALLAVFKSHNDSNVSGKCIANLYSLHSWIGIGVICLYLLQFCMGMYSFALPPITTMSRHQKAQILRLHKFLGPFIYNTTAATILLGIQEKEGFVGCSYSVSKADLFPPQHFFDIPFACRMSHLLGILVLAVTLSTNLALHEF
jgi:cytochrome b-561